MHYSSSHYVAKTSFLCKTDSCLLQYVWYGEEDHVDQRGKSGARFRDSTGSLYLLLNEDRNQAIAKQISPLPKASLRRVKEYMEARLEDNLSLDHLARETHYSRGHFLRMFRAATGKTPHQYLTERRIERAKRVLRDEEETSLIDIAARCGFSSQSHMTRVFREQTGVTPSAFKRRT